jgi:hypothetical protein
LLTRWVPRGYRSTRAHAIASARIRRFCQLPTAGNRINDLQYLGGRGLLLTRFGKFSLTLGKLTFEIGYTLLGIG